MRADDEGEIEIPDAFLPERMKPLRDSSSEGRVNPKGKACLYLATDSNTALAEVRPWRGAHISLGLFKVTRDCALIDFSMDKVRSVDLMLRKEPASTAERALAVWGISRTLLQSH
ncbi:MAG: RES family NAD+ phosphorylase [Acidobacteriaceae bacterium]|nr:RES family NAD+ phosphorylase [Acidobacteriaceae bacterium]